MLLILAKFIFWFLVTSYLIKIALRLLAPILIKMFANKINSRFNQKFNSKDQNSSANEGDVTIERKNNSSGKKSDNLGEYIDFEEIDE